LKRQKEYSLTKHTEITEIVIERLYEMGVKSAFDSCCSVWALGDVHH